MKKLILSLALLLASCVAPVYAASSSSGVASSSFIHRESGAVARTFLERARDAIHVRDFVTGGAGTEASPWTGWCTRIVWAAGKTYLYTNGWYSCPSTLPWRKGGMVQQGESARGTVIKMTGSGNIVELDGGATSTVGLDGTQQQIRDMRFVGTASATNCIYVRNTHHFVIKNVRCNDFTAAGILADFSIHALIEDFVVSPNEGLAGAVACTNGIRLRGDATYGFIGNWTIVNPITGACSGYGIEIGEVNAANNVIINGASESNTLGCIRMLGFAQSNKVHGLYCNNDALDNGTVNQWHGLTGGGHFKITTGLSNTVYGGLFDSITVGSGAADNTFIGVTYSYGAGTFTDSGTRTQKIAVKTYDLTAPVYDVNSLQGSLGVGVVPTNKLHVLDNSGSAAMYLRQDGAGDLFVFASGGTERLRGLKAGGMQFATGTEPTCNAGNKGAVVYVAGGAGVADTLRICSKDAADAYAYRALY